jgi:hypothetical protein
MTNTRTTAARPLTTLHFGDKSDKIQYVIFV